MDGSLNSYLQPIGAPCVYKPIPEVTPLDFSKNFTRNSVSQSKIPFLPVGKIGAGTITVSYNLGSTTSGGAYLQLNGGSALFLVNDGTNNRIAIGSVA